MWHRIPEKLLPSDTWQHKHRLSGHHISGSWCLLSNWHQDGTSSYISEEAATSFIKGKSRRKTSSAPAPVPAPAHAPAYIAASATQRLQQQWRGKSVSHGRPRCLPTNRNEKERPFTYDDEVLVEGMAQNPCLYNTSSSNWKGQESRYDMIVQWAKKMNCTWAHLDKWMASQGISMGSWRDRTLAKQLSYSLSRHSGSPRRRTLSSSTLTEQPLQAPRSSKNKALAQKIMSMRVDLP